MIPFCDSRPLTCTKPKPGYPLRLISIGDHIKAKRLDLKLTHAEVARRLGIDRDTLSMWEAQRTRIAVQYYPAVIDFLGYNPLPEAKTRGEAVARARMSQGLSRARLAELTGIDNMTISRLEADRPRMANRTVRVICAFLGLNST